MLITKSNALNSNFENLTKVFLEDSADWKLIINATMHPKIIDGNNNAFSTILPLKDDATKRSNDDVFYQGETQQIVLEFDHDTLDHQVERAKHVASKIPTVQNLIFSGNKSFHHVLWFRNFASNAKEYREKCFHFLKHLSEEYPELYDYSDCTAEKLKNSDPKRYKKINWENVPDVKIFIPSAYYRQANGIRDNGKIQNLIQLNSIEKFDPQDISEYLIDTLKPSVFSKKTLSGVKVQNPDDIFSRIKEETNLKKFIEEQTGAQFQKNGKLNPCPICNHNDCFSLVNDGLWKCFSDKHDSSGSVIDFVMEWKKLEIKQAIKWIVKKTGIEIETKPKEIEKVEIVFKRFGNMLAEVCYNPHNSPELFLCCYEDGKIEFKSEIEHVGKKYIPITDKTKLIDNNVVLLPSEAKEYGSIDQLITEIIKFIHTYVGLSPFFEKLSAYYVLLSWVYDAFEVIPYLRVIGDYGSGKSTFLKVVGMICYRPILIAGSATPAPVFRIIDKYKGTLLIDEADFKMSDTTDLMVKILNCGYQKGVPVLRMVGEGKNMEPQAFDVYGPKIIGTRFTWTDRALESRCISEDMDGHYRSDLMDISSEFYNEALSLRNKLLLFRFKNINKAKFNPKLKDPSIEPRLNQIAVPLLSIVQDVDVQDELKVFFKEYNRELIRDRAATLTGIIVRAMFDIFDRNTRNLAPERKKNFKLRVKSITEYINHDLEADLSEIAEGTISPQKVGRVIKKYLRLKTFRDQHGRFLKDIENELIHLCERFGVNLENKDENEESNEEIFDNKLPF